MYKAVFLVAAFLCLVFASAALGSQFTLLHSFAGSPNDGSDPSGFLAASGSTLYGTTVAGGAGPIGAAVGTVFSINTDGTGYQLLSNGNAIHPGGPLAISGATLFGIDSGGPHSAGRLYSLGSNGNGFQVLQSFPGSNADGLTLVGSTLYGTTNGALFSVNTDNTNFQTFPAAVGGSELTLAGNMFVGTTQQGGTAGDGTVFAINRDGSGFHVLHSFSRADVSGSDPFAAPTLVGSTLVGATTFAGPTGNGTIYSMNLDGSGFHVLQPFGTVTDMTLVGSTLFGAIAGTLNAVPSIFSMNADGSGFQVIHTFTGGPSDGDALDVGRLTLVGSTLYGTTIGGGASNDGTVFSISVPEPSGTVLGLLALSTLILIAWRRRLRR